MLFHSVEHTKHHSKCNIRMICFDFTQLISWNYVLFLVFFLLLNINLTRQTSWAPVFQLLLNFDMDFICSDKIFIQLHFYLFNFLNIPFIMHSTSDAILIPTIRWNKTSRNASIWKTFFWLNNWIAWNIPFGLKIISTVLRIQSNPLLITLIIMVIFFELCRRWSISK